MMVDIGEEVEVTPPLENPLTLAEVEAAMGFIPVLVVMMGRRQKNMGLEHL